MNCTAILHIMEYRSIVFLWAINLFLLCFVKKAKKNVVLPRNIYLPKIFIPKIFRQSRQRFFFWLVGRGQPKVGNRCTRAVVLKVVVRGPAPVHGA